MGGVKTEESPEALAVPMGSLKGPADTEESQEGLVNTAESPEGMGYTEGSQEGMEDTEEESQEDSADTEEESQEEMVNDNRIIIDDHGWMESEDHYRYEESKENYLGKGDSVDVYENKHVQDEEEMDNYPDLETVGKGFTRVHNNELGNSNERVI